MCNMAKSIYINNNQIIFCYEPLGGIDFIVKKFRNNEELLVKKVLHLSKKDLLSPIKNNNDFCEFIIGYKKDDFQLLKKEVFRTKNDIIFDNKLKINCELIGLNLKFNILAYLEKVLNVNQIKVLNISSDENISCKNYEDLVRRFPNNYELELYKSSRVQSILDDFVMFRCDYLNKYNKYINKKNYLSEYITYYLKNYSQNELLKYIGIKRELSELLKEERVSEKNGKIKSYQ